MSDSSSVPPDAGAGAPDLGATDRLDFDPGEVLSALAQGVDDVAALEIQGRPVYLVIAPELVRQLLVVHADDVIKGPGTRRTRWLLGDGLLTAEGEAHRRARRLVAPAFTRARLTGYVEVMGRRASKRRVSWVDGTALDVHAEMAGLTLEVVGETLLGVELAGAAAPLRRSLDQALQRFAAGEGGGGAGGGGAGSGGAGGAFEAVGDPLEPDDRSIDGLIQEIVTAHEGRADQGDVVSALLAATDEEGGGRLTPTEVRDHLVTLLMAGHETTANALSWTFHLLGAHPEVEARLHQEAVGIGGGLPRLEELPGLPYTRAVVSEAMRLYPPAWILGRSVERPFRLGPVELEVGASVVVSPRVLHRRPEWFPEPDRFDPDRWLDERAAAVPRYAYLPFGLGIRACIGEQFAWAELVTVLAVLARGWHFDPQPGHVVEPQYRVTMRPRGGLPMIARAW